MINNSIIGKSFPSLIQPTTSEKIFNQTLARIEIVECVITQNQIPLSQSISSRMRQITKHKRQKPSPTQTRISVNEMILKIGLTPYANLIYGMLQVQLFKRVALPPFLFLFLALWQMCDDFDVRQSTRYLARTYFDETIHSCEKGKFQDLSTVAITCLSLAIKFNQSQQISEKLTPSYLLNEYHIPLSEEKYLALETKILTILKLKDKLITPYDYCSIFYERFPWLPNMQDALVNVLSLAVAIPEACGYSAEELFYGSVWAIFLYKKAKLSELQKKEIKSMTNGWPNAEIFAFKILEEVQNCFDPASNN